MCHVVVEPRRDQSGAIYKVIFVDVFGRAHVEWIACGIWIPAEGVARWQVEELPLATPIDVENELAREGFRTGGLPRTY